MSDKTELDPKQLRQLRPSVCLKTPEFFEKFTTTGSEAAGKFATAACLTFEDAEVSPEEFLTVYEAIKQCLELADNENPGEKFQHAVSEGFDVSASLLDKEINPAIINWIQEWVSHVDSEADIDVFMEHLNSVATQYALVMSLKHGT
jgi:hypothetical protein